MCCFSFFFNDTATTEIYTLSLHDALPIFERLVLPAKPSARAEFPIERRVPRDRDVRRERPAREPGFVGDDRAERRGGSERRDRKSTRLNPRHAHILSPLFFLKKKNKPLTF